MNKLCIINWEINNLNGFHFVILDIEYGSFEGALFGLRFGRRFLIVDLFFISIEIKKYW